jgi:hypothetical protein
MILRDVLIQLHDETAAAELLLSLGGLPMLARMRQQADTDGVDLATYARETVQRYAARASDEEWLTLLGLTQRTDDPGRACLKHAFERALRQQDQGHFAEEWPS